MRILNHLQQLTQDTEHCHTHSSENRSLEGQHRSTAAMSTTSAAAGLLARQLKQMQNDKDIPGISCGLVDNNVFEWEVMLMINDECKFYGGKALTHLLLSSDRVLTNTSLYRRLLPCAPHLPSRVPAPTAQDGLHGAYSLPS